MNFLSKNFRSGSQTFRFHGPLWSQKCWGFGEVIGLESGIFCQIKIPSLFKKRLLFKHPCPQIGRTCSQNKLLFCKLIKFSCTWKLIMPTCFSLIRNILTQNGIVFHIDNTIRKKKLFLRYADQKIDQNNPRLNAIKSAMVSQIPEVLCPYPVPHPLFVLWPKEIISHAVFSSISKPEKTFTCITTS